MNRALSIVFVLVAAVALVAAGYFLSRTIPQDSNVYRGQVEEPQAPASAPQWVDKGQSAEPDYSAADKQAHNATPAPEPVPTPPPAAPRSEGVQEDPVVTLNFLELLTHDLLQKFHPAAGGKNAWISASFRSLNARFGRALDGFAVSGDDIRASRRTVIDYVLGPGMADKLADLYADLFVDHLADTALRTERTYTLADDTTRTGTLSGAETADMLTLYARLARRVAAAFKGLASDPEITAQGTQYLRASKAVERANAALQEAMDNGSGAGKAGEDLKRAILQREAHKTQAVAGLGRACPSCAPEDRFAMAQWATRRAMEDPKKLDTLPEVATRLERMAEAMERRAGELKTGQTGN